MTEQEVYEAGIEKLNLAGRFHPPLRDLRTDPAFAWKVQVALHKLRKDLFDEWIDSDAESLTDALYAAVMELGREDANDH